MAVLEYDEWIKFIKKTEQDLKNPVGLVSTPKLKLAVIMIEKDN